MILEEFHFGRPNKIIKENIVGGTRMFQIWSRQLRSTFPSASVLISFLTKNSKTVLANQNLGASYGLLGNDQIGA
jgi:hypothetical protein